MHQINDFEVKPGPIVLFGSGETSPSGRKIFDHAMRGLPPKPKVALLETPAGFELNSPQVIGRVADFIRHRLQNYEPQITIVPARRRGTAFSPDNPDLIAPLYEADMIFMGPGSPTYAVRQLRDSLAWYALLASHRLGATIVFASAATVSASLYAIPVYEIYKVGEDLHWKDGLDFFGQYGLPLVFVPHWNNSEGGKELDTSRCFMGQPRFSELMEMIPSELTVLGIDEKTGLVMDPQSCTCRVIGQGGVTILHAGPAHRKAIAPEGLNGTGLHEVAQSRRGHVHHYSDGQFFALSRIGPFHDPVAGEGLPPEVWQRALEARQVQLASEEGGSSEATPPAEVLALVKQRQEARTHKDWVAADQVRQQIAALGWQIQDTPEGPKVVKGEE